MYSPGVILIDDEVNCLDVLEWTIRQQCPQVEILDKCTSAAQGIKSIREKKPDLVFLDIQMPHMNGFELLTELMPVQFDVIFTTAFDQFAIKAFKFSAIDYLLKPIDPDDLKQAILKSTHRTGELPQKGNVDELLNNLKFLYQPTRSKIAIPAMDGLIFVLIQDIISCEAQSNYTIMHIHGQENITATKTLKTFSELLEPYHFLRVHQSHLINMEHLVRYVKGEGGYVVMSDGSIVNVSRTNREKFLQLISKPG